MILILPFLLCQLYTVQKANIYIYINVWHFFFKADVQVFLYIEMRSHEGPSFEIRVFSQVVVRPGAFTWCNRNLNSTPRSFGSGCGSGVCFIIPQGISWSKIRYVRLITKNQDPQGRRWNFPGDVSSDFCKSCKDTWQQCLLILCCLAIGLVHLASKCVPENLWHLAYWDTDHQTCW